MRKPRKPGSSTTGTTCEAEVDSAASESPVDDQELDAQAAGEIARHWFEEGNWPRLEAVLTDLEMLDAILEHRDRSEFRDWWLAIEHETGARVEQRYEAAWRRWQLDPGKPAERLQVRRIAMCLVGLLTDLERRGDFPERLIRIAMQIDAEDDGEDSALVGMHLEMLARLLQARGDHAVAEPVCRRAIAIAEKSEGPNSWAASVRINTLAGVYLEREDYRQAARMYRRSLAIAERIEDPYSEEHLPVLENLVNALMLAGEPADAEPYARRIVAIAESVAEPDALAVGRYVRGLANVLEAAGDFRNALPSRRRALIIAEEGLGKEHPTTLLCVVELAEALAELEKAGEAEFYFRRAVAAAESGPKMPDDWHSRLFLGFGAFLVGKGRHAEAVPYFERVVEMVDHECGQGGRESTALAITLQELGVAYRETGRYEDAGRCLLRAKGIAEACEPPEPLLVAKTLSALGQLRALEGRGTDAEKLFEACLAIRRAMLVEGDAEIAVVEERLRAVRRSGFVREEIKPGVCPPASQGKDRD